MEIIKKRITDMERAEYNPRVELMPGDDEYEAPETGFDLYEIEALENNVDALVDGDFLDSELKSIEETFNISLKFSAEDRDVLKEYIKDNGKEDLVAVIVQKIRGEI